MKKLLIISAAATLLSGSAFAGGITLGNVGPVTGNGNSAGSPVTTTFAPVTNAAPVVQTTPSTLVQTGVSTAAGGAGGNASNNDNNGGIAASVSVNGFNGGRGGNGGDALSFGGFIGGGSSTGGNGGNGGAGTSGNSASGNATGGNGGNNAGGNGGSAASILGQDATNKAGAVSFIGTGGFN